MKIEAVGICGSDIHAYHGHDPRRKPGLVMDHGDLAWLDTRAPTDLPKGKVGQFRYLEKRCEFTHLVV